MNLNNRVFELINNLDLSQTKFAENIGVNRQTINNIVSERNDVSGKVIQAIAQRYKNLNLRWLIKGEGEMFISDSASAVQEDEAEYQTNTKYQKSLEKINELYEKIEALRDRDPEKNIFSLRTAYFCYHVPARNQKFGSTTAIARAYEYQ